MAKTPTKRPAELQYTPANCHAREVLARIGDKWSVYVMHVLGEARTVRFNELRSQVDGISQRMLTVTLRGLERDGIVARTVYPEVPPRVEYALTPLGATLRQLVRALVAWSGDHLAEVDATSARMMQRLEERHARRRCRARRRRSALGHRVRLGDVATTKRCPWAGTSDPLMLEYHDREWGVPVHDDRVHFEFLLLEGAQAGLSWAIVLKKREGYRRAFSQFDPEKVARYTAKRVEKLMADPGIVRNRLKIAGAGPQRRAFENPERVRNVRAYCWRFVGGRPKVNRWKTMGIRRRRPNPTRSAKISNAADSPSSVLRHLCLHAGGRYGERSSRRLFPVSRDSAAVARWREEIFARFAEGLVKGSFRRIRR
jgi:DNA-3-methyladenine glycosylase I